MKTRLTCAIFSVGLALSAPAQKAESIPKAVDTPQPSLQSDSKGNTAKEVKSGNVPESPRAIGGKLSVGYAVAGMHELFDDPATRNFIFSNITNVVLIGAVSSDGKGVVSVDEKKIGNAVSVTHAKGRKISATFGVQGAQFTGLLESSDARKTLITNVIQTCGKHQFDGADFDYEYPHRMQDRLNFEAFLKELRQAAPKEMLISVAVSAWDHAPNLVPVGAASSLDWVFLMAYGPHPNGMKHENQARQAQNCLKWGLPASKLVLGLPIYGSRVGPDGKGHDGPSYAQLIGTNKLDRTIDEFGGWHFNGPAAIERNTQYVYDNGMAGVGWWYLTCDTLDDRSLTQTAAKKLRALAERDVEH